ncbi:MAG: ABC transporter permease [Candidatus Aquicultorales bacterium]
MGLVSGSKRAISDTIVMSGRVLRHNLRSIDTIITVVAMPIVMMIMFVYIFGGSIDTGSGSYINFVVPGTVLMCITSGVAYGAIRIHNDFAQGIIDRFRSMPIAKSSILGGHVLTSLVFNAFSTVLVLFVALLFGFRPGAGPVGWLLVTGILLLFTLAMTWIAVMFSLLAKTYEGAGVFSYFLLLLLFVSSGFAPTKSMPKLVRLFAENQPMTHVINSVRALMLDTPVGNATSIAVMWCLGVLTISSIAALQIYKRKTA